MIQQVARGEVPVPGKNEGRVCIMARLCPSRPALSRAHAAACGLIGLDLPRLQSAGNGAWALPNVENACKQPNIVGSGRLVNHRALT
jgi:hypothetical protein